MRRLSRRQRSLAIVLGAGLLLGLVAWFWLIPVLIVSQLESITGGTVSIRGWWLGRDSAGLTGVVLRESRVHGAPVWARADRVAADITLGGLLLGHLVPARITVRRPRFTFRMDRTGGFLHLPTFKSTGTDNSSLPTMVVEDGQVAFQPEGRPAMVISRINARLSARAEGAVLAGRTDDPAWGHWTVGGSMATDFDRGSVQLEGRQVTAAKPMLERIAFVPQEVWSHIEPCGAVDVAVLLRWVPEGAGSVDVRTEVSLHDTAARLPHLDITLARTTGRVVIERGVVTLEDVHAEAGGGTITAAGSIDFRDEPARLDLALDVRQFDVARGPRHWKLLGSETAGRLTGSGHLLAELKPDGDDFSGSTGQAIVTGGMIDGIPVKSLSLMLHDGSKAPPPGTALRSEPPRPALLTTRAVLDDVDLAELVARARPLIGQKPLPPVQGRLSLTGEATIPLKAPVDIRHSVAHAVAALTDTTLAQVDLPRLTARIALAEGVLDLDEVHGDLRDPRARTDPGAASKPITAGAEHSLAVSAPAAARLLLALPDPPGGVPDRELALGLLPGFDPLVVDDSPAQAGVVGGRGRLDLNPPYRFSGTLDVAHGDAGQVLDLIPGASSWGIQIQAFDIQAQGSGTLAPLAVESSGRGRLRKLVANAQPFGDIPFQWSTEGNDIVLQRAEARVLGGRVVATARLPLASDQPLTGTVALQGIDTAQLAAAIPGRPLLLRGRADGRAVVTAARGQGGVTARVELAAPDLEVDGIPTTGVQADIRVETAAIAYALSAESLGGKLQLQGNIPLHNGKGTSIPDPGQTARFRAVDVALESLGKALGVTGPALPLTGLGTLDASVRREPAGPHAGLWLRGATELRNLAWGPRHPLGQLRGEIVLTPAGWRINPITGSLLGGVTHGSVWSESDPPADPAEAAGASEAPSVFRQPMAFELHVDHAALNRAFSVVPELAGSVDGFGALRLTGTLGDTLRTSAELDVAQAQIAGLPLQDMRFPAELVFTPAAGHGTLHLRRGTARLAGGHVQTDAVFRLGEDRSFQGEFQLAALDLESIARLHSEARRPAAGKVSGKITLASPSPGVLSRYRGRVNLELRDAAVVELPVFREIDRFLGSARGGLFEFGELVGAIADRRLHVERLTMAGRLAQLHATGTVSADGQLDLDVLVNTNQIIPQTGAALVRLIPGLSEVLGRRDAQASLRVANFLSNRLLKLHVGGTLRNPSVNLDPGVVVVDTAVAFFGGVLKLPLGMLK